MALVLYLEPASLAPRAVGYRQHAFAPCVPGAVGGAPIRRFDGFGAWEELPSDGRTVADMWF
jgi:hypothetical protein